MMLTENLIKKHEGLRLKPYYCTGGKLTIGYGRNLDDNGINQLEAEFMLINDIDSSVHQLEAIFPDYLEWPEEARAAMCSMMFNLGATRFRTFKRMIAAIHAQDYEKAITELLSSRYATQVPNRVNEIAGLLRKAWLK
jgi:lysozyme